MSDVHLAPRVHDATAGSARLLLLDTGVRDVVSFRGSFESAPDLGAADDVVQSLVANLLDKGTRPATGSRSRRPWKAAGPRSRSTPTASGSASPAGPSATTSPTSSRSSPSSSATPALDADEVQKAVVRAVAGVRRSLESTGAQASGALARRLYGPAHPNYALAPEAELAAVRGRHARSRPRSTTPTTSGPTG